MATATKRFYDWDAKNVIVTWSDVSRTPVESTVARALAKKSVLTGRFDITNPRAQAWARERSSSLITGVSKTTREAIRGVIERAFSEGIPPRAAARLIRPMIGLTPKDAQAVMNLRARLEDASGQTVYAGSRAIRVPEDGFSDEEIENYTDRYSDRLLQDRSETISRTETIAASNEGQRELWEQMVEDGLLDASEQREWSVAEDDRLCPICEDLDGQLAGLDEEFVTMDGERVIGPPAHPNCRCATVLSGKKAQRAASARVMLKHLK